MSKHSTETDEGAMRAHVRSGVDAESTANPLRAATIILRSIRIVVAVPIVLVCIVVGLSLTVFRPEYVARSSILPQVNQGPMSRYSTLAAQFGVAPSPGGAGESVAFYETLLTSRSLLEAAVLSEYDIGQSGATTIVRTANLIELLGVGGADDEERLRNAYEALHSRVGTRVAVESGVITVSVRAPSTVLAEQINRRLLDLLSHYNLERRQSQASAERRFTEARMADAKMQLTAAEQTFQQFLEGNRNYQNSPQLAFEAARLQREVEYQHQLVAALAQAFEQARIEEVRNTPVVTIVDVPEGSVTVASSIVRRILVSLMFGLLVGLLAAFAMDYSRQWRNSAPAYEEFVEARRRAAAQLMPRRPTAP